MAQQIERKVEYYYDLHPTKEDLMGESPAHARLVHYLMEVLEWYFREQVCAIHENCNFYLTLDSEESPIAPDIAVIKGVEPLDGRSWSIPKMGAVPQVVFEIGSKETWKDDREDKPTKYALMGVQEYFAYDPNQPPLLRRNARRLYGWQLDANTGLMHRMLPGPGGRLWSVHLDSWLVPDGGYLRLYDRSGHMRLTGQEAEAEGKRTALRRAETADRRA